MKRLLTLSALAAAALMTSACVTVIDAGDNEHINWTGENAQPFDASRDACSEHAGRNQASKAFETCMATRGWTRG